MSDTLVQYTYLASAALFILALRWMGQVKSSRHGNWAGTAAMVLAIIGTLVAGAFSGKFTLAGYGWIATAVVIGSAIGIPMALIMPMTAVPQRTALSHAFGGLAAALVGIAEYYEQSAVLPHSTAFVLGAEVLLGSLTFTGSLLAFAKLQELISGQPIVYPGRNFASIGTLSVAILATAYLTYDPQCMPAMATVVGSALLFGVLLLMPIGGADMPTVIAILNSYAGLSASAMGFVLNNKLLIIAGALDGSSGLILAIMMCKAMNRSFSNVLFGAVGQIAADAGQGVSPTGKTVVGYSIEDAKSLLENTRLVIVVPGYGLAVAQAQHAVKELAAVLQAQGTEVIYAIHPVAGRMPGHMNVVLAEADIPYDQLWEMERVNPRFAEADVAIVLGANDVTNPAARTNKTSPLYGMPILDVDKAKTVIFVKRSMKPGFAGIDNELFYLDRTVLVFGDAKKVVSGLIAAFKESVH